MSAEYSHVFQAMDQTIADVCLRELDWSNSPASLWETTQTGPWDHPATQAESRSRMSEVYRLSRPLILHLLKADKSPMKNMKKLSIARSMMDAGNKNLQANNMMDALNMYNKAVVFAPNVDDNLGKACAERAHVLLILGDYKRALTDIQQAEQCEYQFEKRFELEERKGLAYLGLNQPENAKQAFNKSICLLEDAAGFLHKKFVERKMRELHDNLKACIYSKTDSFTDNFRNLKIPPELKGRNKKYPALSDKVDFGPAAASANLSPPGFGPGSSTLPSFGHNSPTKSAMYCVGEVSAGDIIGLEKPLATFLEKDYMRTNCWNCLVTIKAPYGCPLCSAVKFCSRECLREACSTYHPSECLLTDIIVSNRIGSWPLAFRSVAATPLKQALAVGRNGGGPAGLNSLVNLQLPPSTDNQEEIKKRSLMSVFYLIILQMTGYFDAGEGGANPSLSSIQQMKGCENDSSLSEDELHIATLIDKMISVSSYCTTDVCHFQLKGDVDWTSGSVTPVIGRTMNPTLVMVNHSCYPSAARVCLENKTLLVAQKNLKAGEPVTINYSAPFYAASRSDRQSQLSSSYLLNCSCTPCVQDWPLFDELTPGPQALPDPPLTTGPQALAPQALSSAPQALTPLVPKALSEKNRVMNGFELGSLSKGLMANNQTYTPTEQGLNRGGLMTSNNNQTYTATEQAILDAFRTVKSKLDQLQRSSQPGQPPSKMMIQTQVRLFRCLLAMYSSKLRVVKTEYGSLSIPV